MPPSVAFLAVNSPPTSLRSPHLPYLFGPLSSPFSPPSVVIPNPAALFADVGEESAFVLFLFWAGPLAALEQNDWMTAPPQLAHDWHTPAPGPTVSYHSPMAPKLGKISRSPLKVKTAKLRAKKLAQHAPQTSLLAVCDSRCVPAQPPPSAVHRIFLLSPANINGVRARLILRENATFPLALRLRDGGLSLGESFSFISGLYFRGKLAYARAFAQPPPHAGARGAMVITACGGLLPAETLVTGEDLCKISSASVSLSEARYRVPFERDARLLADEIGPRCEVVLLGSVATPKYVDPLLRIFGERLLFPAEFAGRGDMSRGGLMLRCVQSGVPLNYVPVATSNRHGTRPPKLPPLHKVSRPA
jgi:hypothetical protein